MTKRASLLAWIGALGLASISPGFADGAPCLSESRVEVSGSLTLVSDHRARGLTVSDNETAVQGSLEVSGEAVSAFESWGRSFDLYTDQFNSELDLYASHMMGFGAAELGVSLTWYHCPHADDLDEGESQPSLWPAVSALLISAPRSATPGSRTSWARPTRPMSSPPPALQCGPWPTIRSGRQEASGAKRAVWPSRTASWTGPWAWRPGLALGACRRPISAPTLLIPSATRCLWWPSQRASKSGSWPGCFRAPAATIMSPTAMKPVLALALTLTALALAACVSGAGPHATHAQRWRNIPRRHADVLRVNPSRPPLASAKRPRSAAPRSSRRRSHQAGSSSPAQTLQGPRASDARRPASRPPPKVPGSRRDGARSRPRWRLCLSARCLGSERSS